MNRSPQILELFSPGLHLAQHLLFGTTLHNLGLSSQPNRATTARMNDGGREGTTSHRSTSQGPFPQQQTLEVLCTKRPHHPSDSGTVSRLNYSKATSTSWVIAVENRCKLINTVENSFNVVDKLQASN